MSLIQDGRPDVAILDAGLGLSGKYWLALSATSRQVVLQGGHDLYEEVREQVAAEILQELP